MPVTDKVDFSRKEAAIEAIVEATARLMKANVDSFPATRQIATTSGYSTGTIYNYFSSVGSVISHVVIKRQRAAIRRVEAAIDQHDPNAPIAVLCRTVLDMYFSAFTAHDPRLVRFVFNTARQHAEKPELLDRAVDPLVYPLLKAIQRDRTGTFRPLGEPEILAFLHGAVFFVRNPLLEGSAFFATPTHRQIVTDYMMRVFARDADTTPTAPTETAD